MKIWSLLYPLLFLNTLAAVDPSHLEKSSENASEASLITQKLPVEIGPLLPLSLNFPIEISSENRKNFFSDEILKEEAKVNQRRYEETFFPWLLILLPAGIALTVWGIKWLQRNRRQKFESKEEAEARYRLKALHLLESLQPKNLSDQKQFLSYFTTLSDVVREYIEKKYQLPAPTRTTQEFMNEVAGSSEFDPAMRVRLSQFLSIADEVKFADYKPSIDECIQAQSAAKSLVQK